MFFIGGPHSRVRESKPGFMTFRKEGGPGTKKQKTRPQNVTQDLFMGFSIAEVHKIVAMEQNMEVLYDP